MDYIDINDVNKIKELNKENPVVYFTMSDLIRFYDVVKQMDKLIIKNAERGFNKCNIPGGTDEKLEKAGLIDKLKKHYIDRGFKFKEEFNNKIHYYVIYW